MEPEQVREAVKRRNAGALVLHFFGIRLRPSQARVANLIVFDLRSRVALRSPTQVGKTFTVAVALCLKLLIRPGHRIGWVAPTFAKTKVSQGYVADLLVSSPHLQALLGKADGVDSLRREASKTRLVFKDGGELHFHSAEGTGLRLMSFGSYDTLVEEEAGETSDEVARKMIARMASKPSSISPRGCQRVKLGNPWRKPSHFHDACVSPRWFSVHWTLEECLREGAFDPEFIEEQREQLTEVEFRVLYEAEFPENVEGGLLREDLITAALRGDKHPDWPVESVGIDVGGEGADFTVATAIRFNPDDPSDREADQLTIDGGDPELQAERFHAWIGGPGDFPVRYDAIGEGSAWGVELRRLGYRAIAVKWSEAPDDKGRFARAKGEQYWHLREVLELVRLPKADPRLVEQLHLPTYSLTTAGKIDVLVPGRKTGAKSPDHSDSLVLAGLPIRKRRPGALVTW